MKIRKDFQRLIVITGASGASVLIINVLFLSAYEQVYAILNLVGAVLILGVPLMYKYYDYKKIRKIEEMFPKYLEDVSENISAGMTLPQAIRSIASIDYDVLTPHIKEIASKVSWGVPFEKVMEEFAKKTRSKAMKRNVQTIIETHRSGGSMDTVLRSVAQSLVELEKVKKERSSSVYAQMINGYVIYVVFLGVMVGLQTVMVPAFQFNEDSSNLKDVFGEIFRSLVIIQGFFAGLSIGKMAEGTFSAGFKHALVLVVFGYTIFTFIS
jgi:flagellar protein FlaJ